MIKLFEEIIDITSENVSLDNAKKAYEYLLMDKEFTSKNGIPIRFTNRGFNEFFYSVEQVMNEENPRGAATKLINRNKHEIEKLLATVQYLGDVVANMDFNFYQKNQKLEKKRDVRGYEYFSCPVNIDGKQRTVKLAFEKLFGDKNKEGKYYYHFIESKENIYQLILKSFEII